MNLKPLGDRLIVEPLEEEQTTIGGIVLPDTALEKPQRGNVVAAGPGARSQETGAHGRSLGKLGDIRYWFNWEGERIFKVVSFFLVRYESGKLGEIPMEFRHEVAEVRWLPLDDAPRLLAYQGERRLAEKAIAVLAGEEEIG